MRTIVFFFSLAFLFGCNNVIPGNFWFNFKSHHITKEFSEQSPFGGTTIVNWELTDEEFTTDEVIRFAEEHSWIYLSTKPESEYPHEANQCRNLDRFLNDYQDILIFETNWISIEQESGEAMDAFGYIFLDEERKKMTVFHQWGE